MYARSKQIYLFFLIPAFLFSAVVCVQAQGPVAQVISKNNRVKNFSSLLKQAGKFEREKRFAEALELYEQVLVLKPDDAGIYNNIGALYAKMERYHEALPALKRAIELDPDSAPTQFNLSTVYRHLKRLDEALVPGQQAVKLKPRNIKFRMSLCELDMELNRFEEAVSCYDTLTKNSQPDARIQTFYGLALVRAKHLKKGLSVLRKTVQFFPEYPEAYNILGVALISKKEYKEAIESMRRALEINPNYAPARFNLAIAQMGNKNRAAALKHYRILQNSNSVLAERLYKIIFSDKVLFVGSR